MARIELCYLPPVSWYLALAHAPVVELEACEHYQKGSWRNRCRIAGPNGRQELSIPLQKGKNRQTPIREVRIAYDEPWRQVHWRSIATAYGNAPYFEHYEDALRGFYEKRPVFLFDFNLELLEWVNNRIGWQKSLVLTEVWAPETGADDFRNRLSPKREAPENLRPKPYPQVFADRFGFFSDLSVLDLLLCQGKQSLYSIGIS